MTGTVRLRFGGTVFEYRAPAAAVDLSEEVYQCFVTEEQPDVRIEVHYGCIPDVESWEKVFDAGEVWSLASRAGKWVISLYSPVAEANIYQVAIEPHVRNLIDFLNNA